jgi:hypothetical protein
MNMRHKSALMVLADRFQQIDPTLSREQAVLKADDEVTRLMAGKGLSKDAERARSLRLRADALVAAGKTREDAIVQADREIPVYQSVRLQHRQ